MRGKHQFLAIIMSILLTFPAVTSAQTGERSSLVEESIVDMYIVAGAGLGGALLGLSTLSFMSEPSDHMKNILVGGALGVIGGVAVVAYSTANKGKDMYETGFIEDGDFSTFRRVAWHYKSFQSHFGKREFPQVSVDFTF